MYSNSKDQKAIEEAYKKMFLAEERPRFTPHGIRITWSDHSTSGEYDDEIVVDGKVFYAKTKYDLDYTIDDGDQDTPPSFNINDTTLIDPHFSYMDENENEFEITKEKNPELYQKIEDATILKIEEFETDYLNS